MKKREERGEEGGELSLRYERWREWRQRKGGGKNERVKEGEREGCYKCVLYNK